jgi:S1-C subfamily serine protease
MSTIPKDNLYNNLTCTKKLTANQLLCNEISTNLLDCSLISSVEVKTNLLSSVEVQTNLLSSAEVQTELLVDYTGRNIWSKRHAVVSLYMVHAPSISVGSGFFISPNGYLVTAAHNVVNVTAPVDPNTPRARADPVYASATNVNGVEGVNERIEMEIVGVDGAGDIAVLKPKTVVLTNQMYLKWGNSRDMYPGDTVFLMGDPRGSDQQSISKGIMRDNTYIAGLSVECCFFDASIYGGNSGGPLVDSLGNVLGISTFSNGSPTDAPTMGGGPAQYIAERVVNKIISSNSDYVKGYLGWVLFPLTIARRSYPQLNTDTTASTNGQLVLDLRTPCVPGMAQWSIITHIDGIEVSVFSSRNKEQISNVTWFKLPGDTVAMTYRDAADNFATKTTTFTLDTFPVGYEFPLHNYQSSPLTSGPSLLIQHTSSTYQ